MNVKLLKIVNVVLGLDFLFLVTTALLRTWIPYGIFRVIHPMAGLTLVVLVVTHVYLNRGWVRQNYFKKK